MSPARQHRERHAARGLVPPSAIVSRQEGGQSAPVVMGTDLSSADDMVAVVPFAPNTGISAARRHSLIHAATAPAPPTDPAETPRPRSTAEAQMALRLTHDLRRLHEIHSIERKIEAKREMLSEYRDWVAGLLAADAGVPDGAAADVVPTVMVWLIDTGNPADALPVAEFVLRHKVAMPARYKRHAAAVLVEEIAAAALKAQGAGDRFPLAVLVEIDRLTAGWDYHDEIRAKLDKAIGIEQEALAGDFDGQAERTALAAALASLKRAQALHDRIGVKDRIKRIEKQLSTPPEPAAPAA